MPRCYFQFYLQWKELVLVNVTCSRHTLTLVKFDHFISKNDSVNSVCLALYIVHYNHKYLQRDLFASLGLVSSNNLWFAFNWGSV